jgi:hypothetical protein
MIYPGFCGPSYASQSPIADAELCLNFYTEQMESSTSLTVIAHPTLASGIRRRGHLAAVVFDHRQASSAVSRSSASLQELFATMTLTNSGP